jgi:hypothetical protein
VVTSVERVLIWTGDVEAPDAKEVAMERDNLSPHFNWWLTRAMEDVHIPADNIPDFILHGKLPFAGQTVGRLDDNLVSLHLGVHVLCPLRGL